MIGSVANKRSLSNESLGKISRSFKDLSFNFTKHPITNDIVVLKNEEAIKQSVKNLVLTKLRERPFRPEIGTDSTSYLFELNRNCLLYTSPSPRDRQKSRMPSSA